MSLQPIIAVEHLSKVYPLYADKRDRLVEALDPFRRKRHTDFYALRDVSFTVEKGESVGIIGVNGSGKSTLLKVLTGVLSPSAGRVEVLGRVSALLELGAGFHPERTGRENVYFQGTLQGMEKKEIDAYLPAVLEFADIGDFIDQPVKLYSSGMYVRLAFAAAIQGDPDILIVDEALAVGDMAFQFKCMSKMQSLMQNGATVLFVSHAMDSVKSFCQRAIYLAQGNVLAIGPAAEIGEMYLRDQRNQTTRQLAGAVPLDVEDVIPAALALGLDASVEYKIDPDFERRVIRQGTGDVRFTCVEVLNEQGDPVTQAEFNQKVTVRLHLTFHTTCNTHVGYNIRNRLNEGIIESYTVTEGYSSLHGNAGDRLVVDFTTQVPLREGAYSVGAVASIPVADGVYRFNDMAAHAVIFHVLARRPIKIWTAAYVPNTLAVHYIGKREEFTCPLCGQSHPGYLPVWKDLQDNITRYGFDVQALRMEFGDMSRLSCPVCGGMDRERMSAEYLLRRLGAGFADTGFRFLEFSPNPAFSNFLQRNFSFRHETADLLRPDVDHTLDLTNMPEIESESVDAWISLHMLEHIPDDLAALRELYRILKPGGFGLLLVPLSLSLEKSDEDPQATVEERWRRFGQDDHIRMYAKKDFVERIGKAGFSLLQLGEDWFGEECFQRLGLPGTAVLYVLEKKI